MNLEKTVTIILPAISVTVSGANENELLENAKLAVAKQLSDGDFPRLSYSINSSDSLTIDTVKEGMIVEVDSKVGIVTAVNKKNILVTYSSGITVQGPPTAFVQSTKSFDEARSRRLEHDKSISFWKLGDSGYLAHKGEVYEVVIGKMVRNKAKIHVVNGDKGFTVDSDVLDKVIKDEKNEVSVA